MAPDTHDSGVSLEFHELAADLLPPTHPRGPRSLFFLVDNPVPKPPTARGWEQTGITVPPVARPAMEAHAVPDTASVDRTFENETRPHR